MNTTITAQCGCEATGRFITDSRCTVIDRSTITGRERMRHSVAALKKVAK